MDAIHPFHRWKLIQNEPMPRLACVRAAQALLSKGPNHERVDRPDALFENGVVAQHEHTGPRQELGNGEGPATLTGMPKRGHLFKLAELAAQCGEHARG